MRETWSLADFEAAVSAGDSKAAYLLGRAYDLALGVTQDYARARSLYSQACDGGNETACGNLTRLPD